MMEPSMRVLGKMEAGMAMVNRRGLMARHIMVIGLINTCKVMEHTLGKMAGNMKVNGRRISSMERVILNCLMVLNISVTGSTMNVRDMASILTQIVNTLENGRKVSDMEKELKNGQMAKLIM